MALVAVPADKIFIAPQQEICVLPEPLPPVEFGIGLVLGVAPVIPTRLAVQIKNKTAFVELGPPLMHIQLPLTEPAVIVALEVNQLHQASRQPAVPLLGLAVGSIPEILPALVRLLIPPPAP